VLLKLWIQRVKVSIKKACQPLQLKKKTSPTGLLGAYGGICIPLLKIWIRLLAWIIIHYLPLQAAKLLKRERNSVFIQLIELNLFVQQCGHISHFSFSSLINIDGQPDSSGGQNLKQDHLLSPCYHRNGFRWGPPDTGEKGKLIHEAQPRVLSTLLLLPFALPFSPLLHLHSLL